MKKIRFACMLLLLLAACSDDEIVIEQFKLDEAIVNLDTVIDTTLVFDRVIL